MQLKGFVRDILLEITGGIDEANKHSEFIKFDAMNNSIFFDITLMEDKESVKIDYSAAGANKIKFEVNMGLLNGKESKWFELYECNFRHVQV